MDTIGNFFDKIILHINSYILPLKIDKISKFCLKLLSSVKKKVWRFGHIFLARV